MKTRTKSIILLSILTVMGSSVFAADDSIANASGISGGLLLSIMLGVIIVLLITLIALTKGIQSIGTLKKRNISDKALNNVKKGAIVLILFGLNFSLFAAETEAGTTSSFTMSNTLLWILSVLIVFLFFLNILLYRTFMTLVRYKRGESFVKDEALIPEIKLTDRVPVEEEESIMLDHVYDGIRELDNDLPPWWKYLFYATIIFSVVYLIRFHITGDGPSSLEEYTAELEKAEEEKAAYMATAAESITEENVKYLIDASSLASGAEIFKSSCASCHGQLGEGGAGPNLTDVYWIHGGHIKDVFSTVKYGVPAKGMIAWESILNPAQIQEVSSFILSLKGSNPPNAKSPQGDEYIEEERAASETETAADNDTIQEE